MLKICTDNEQRTMMADHRLFENLSKDIIVPIDPRIRSSVLLKVSPFHSTICFLNSAPVAGD